MDEGGVAIKAKSSQATLFACKIKGNQGKLRENEGLIKFKPTDKFYHFEKRALRKESAKKGGKLQENI